MKQKSKKSALKQTNQKPWWEDLPSKAYEDQSFVVEFSIIPIINKENKWDGNPHLIRKEVFKSDGVNFDHRQRADQYFDKLYDDYQNNRDLIGDNEKLIEELRSSFKVMVILDYYTCDEKGNILYYNFTLDDWDIVYNLNITYNGPEESDIYPDDGSSEFEEN